MSERRTSFWLGVAVQVIGCVGLVQQIVAAVLGKPYDLTAIAAFTGLAGAPGVISGYVRREIERERTNPPSSYRGGSADTETDDA